MKRLQYETGQSTVSADDAAGLRDLRAALRKPRRKASTGVISKMAL
jgi:hypothetical protein